MSRPYLTCVSLAAILAATQVTAAPELSIPEGARSSAAALESAFPSLARQALAQSPDLKTEAHRNDRFALELAAGDYQQAAALAEASRAHSARSAGADSRVEVSRLMPLWLYAQARALERSRHQSFAAAFRTRFKARFAQLDDPTAVDAGWALGTLPSVVRARFEQALGQFRGAAVLSLDDVLLLAGSYDYAHAYADFGPLIESLVSEDDARRYIIDTHVLIHARNGATLSAIVVRPRGQTSPQPTALSAGIQTDTQFELHMATYAAARGYVGVYSDTRGKRLSPDSIVPYEDDAQDIYWVIDWIARQPWSDGKVGMWGGSYGGFEQWAAAKSLHPALKTIVPYCPEDPGYGLPMQDNVFLTANYAYVFYVTDNKYVDEETYDEYQSGPRRTLFDHWYRSGRPYRQIDQVDGRPNPWLQRWLNHPAYDAYWQSMTAYGSDFARLDIPILAIDGYYDDGQNNAMRRMLEHQRQDPHAQDYLLIGPYDHFGTQSSFKPPVLRGYTIDPVAQFDTLAVTFQWFDHVLRGGPLPAVLKDRINYEVMGANVWRHAPSLEKTHDETLKLYLGTARAGDYYALTRERPAKPSGLTQTVNFADRSTASSPTYPAEILSTKLDRPSGFAFVSTPFSAPVAVTGLISADLKLVTNKKDLDIAMVFYELTPTGHFFHLADIVQRASYARDATERHLLEPGKVESVPIRPTLFVSRQLRAGSRLLVVLDVNRGPSAQVNYGTGRDVSDESIADAKVPLNVEWLDESVVSVPISMEGRDP
jgi:uncharacterized protein